MVIRDKLNQIRREYRKEADRLDKRIDEAEAKADKGLEKVQLQMQSASVKLEMMAAAIKEEFGAVAESIQQLREDQREVSRTMSGRSRLLEDRFGKMIEAVETGLEDELSGIHQRLEALEHRSGPAA